MTMGGGSTKKKKSGRKKNGDHTVNIIKTHLGRRKRLSVYSVLRSPLGCPTFTHGIYSCLITYENFPSLLQK